MVGEATEVTIGRLVWTTEIVEHIARHSVTPADVEHAISRVPRVFRNLPGRSASHVIIGRDARERALFVPIQLMEEPDVWSVVSAWESRYARRLLDERQG